MAYTDRMLLTSVAVITFLASIATMLRGQFGYPLELFLIALLGVLLVVSLNTARDDAASSFLFVLFFLAAIANTIYLYSVASYMSPARLATISISAIGLALSAMNMFMQPVPGKLKSEVKMLLAAEKKISEARQKLDKVGAGVPKASRKRAGKRAAKKK